DLSAASIRVELDNARAIRLRCHIGDIRKRTDGDVHLLAVGGKDDVAGPVSTAVEQTTAGKLGAEFFRWAACLDVATAIRKSNDPVGIRHIKKLRLESGGIEGDPERVVHAVISENLSRRRRVSAPVTQ